MDSEVLATLILNRLKNNLKICVIKSPSFGDNRKATMQDLAAFTGSEYICEEAGLYLDKCGETP